MNETFVINNLTNPFPDFCSTGGATKVWDELVTYQSEVKRCVHGCFIYHMHNSDDCSMGLVSYLSNLGKYCLSKS